MKYSMNRQCNSTTPHSKGGLTSDALSTASLRALSRLAALAARLPCALPRLAARPPLRPAAVTATRFVVAPTTAPCLRASRALVKLASRVCSHDFRVIYA
ncbi:unnamed protein product [Closterium sp. NIES-54]